MSDNEVKLGKGIYSTLNEKIELKDHPKFDGKGLFAKSFIKKGELIWKESIDFEFAPEFTFEEINSWPKEQQEYFGHFAYQISENKMKGPNPFDKKEPSKPEDDASNFMNHSCDPTCWFDDYLTMSARRDIEKGEEITYDYATTELNETKKIIECGCGTKECRGKLTRDDFKIEKLQEKYKGHFLPHVLKEINKMKI